MTRYALLGSERKPVSGARVTGKADPEERLEVTVVVRRRRGGEALHEHVRKLALDRSAKHIRREDFAGQFGAEASDIAAVKTFAQAHNLAVVQEDQARRSIILSGTVRQFNDAFGVDLQRFEHAGGSYRGRTGPIMVPEELHGVVEAVLGLDNRPIAKPHFRSHLPQGNVAWRAESGSFTPVQLAQLYNFPPGNGAGQCIGIIELGGGYRPADLSTYFGSLPIAGSPQVTAVSVDHGQNQPTGDPNGPDGEVMLDIEVVGAVAPAANIVVYFAPNTDAGFLDAITTAIHDTANKPSVISISWGGPESGWTQQTMTAFDQAFQAAAAMGVTVCVASGDNGSGDGVNDAADHVDFPASSPYALACGGTSVRAASNTISGETVWNDGAQGGATGGGVSTFFPLPEWQQNLTVATAQGGTQPLQMRGVPDVSGDADPLTGYNVRVDGSDTVIGGTSAVAPLWAGLIALINAAKGSPVGLVHPTLYAHPEAFRDVTQGNNGDFVASTGWDACTGLGSPNGQKIAAVFMGQTAQTAPVA
jgi:kumamolisin